MDTRGRGGHTRDDAAGEKRGATLRSRMASLTATACRGAFDDHGPAAGEGTR
ncbi:DUF6380 family protein [Streptomyces sp. NPDC058122]|uniref:DUF6380 family protein n=1 Tax=Streptomyces sp. NPDC058122 TaxID=3346349 RepID=UPI0036E44522